jgi:predicted peptidase
MIRYEADRNCLWLRPWMPAAGWRAPTIIFLHGIGERGLGGAELSRVALWGLPKLWAAAPPAVRSFAVVAPQCPPDHRWTDPEVSDALDELTASAAFTDTCDPERLYITGFSMGGIGAFAWALRRPRLFASLVSVCGACEEPERLEEIAHLPAWIAWAEDDEIVRLTQGSREAALRLAPHGRLVALAYRLGAVGSVGAHPRTADAAFAERLLYPWLLRWRLPAP